MSQPVPHHTGETRHEIRNTTGGFYLFAPTKLLRQAFMFILATASRRYQVGIVAYAMMSNHIHILVVDLSPDEEPSEVPDFRKFVRSTFAQFVNAHWDDHSGSVVCKDSTGDTINVIDFDSIVEAIVYIETNGMKAGMERSPEMLDGAVSQRRWMLEPVKIERPSFFFQESTWEAEEELRLVLPPEAARVGHTVESFYKLTTNELDREVKRILREFKKAGRKFKRLHVLERYDWTRRSDGSAADHSEAPLACKDPERTARAFEELRSFRRKHRRAMERLRRGEDDVVFPAGTYLAAKRYGVAVASRRKTLNRPSLE